MSTPHILVSNDDGIFAPGLLMLANAMRKFGTVTVMAPEENQSANGHRKTLTKPLRVTPVRLGEGISAYSVDGSPADCVALALMGILPSPIDMVVSGINRGANLGQDLTYSGTVAATLEATIFGKPAVAFSYQDRSLEADYSPCHDVAQKVVAQVLAHGLPPKTLLNVNIPNVPEIKGVQITRQGTSIYHDQLITRLDPTNRPYYWIGGEAPSGDVTVEGTDIWAVHHGYVSVTPVHLDLTAHQMIAQLQSWTLA
jgi:5'-nucleotidase